MGTGDWTEERVETDGDTFFAAVLADIAAAVHCVTVETYILAADPIGQALLTGLEAAHDRGVDVQLLVDGVGAGSWVASRPQTRIRWRIYHPPPWLVVGAPLPDAFRMLNRRNHRTVCILDDRVAWRASSSAGRRVWVAARAASFEGAESGSSIMLSLSSVLPLASLMALFVNACSLPLVMVPPIFRSS